jgi:hypothetical protein
MSAEAQSEAVVKARELLDAPIAAAPGAQVQQVVAQNPPPGVTGARQDRVDNGVLRRDRRRNQAGLWLRA